MARKLKLASGQSAGANLDQSLYISVEDSPFRWNAADRLLPLSQHPHATATFTTAPASRNTTTMSRRRFMLPSPCDSELPSRTRCTRPTRHVGRRTRGRGRATRGFDDEAQAVRPTGAKEPLHRELC